jgi:hypothetical protein
MRLRTSLAALALCALAAPAALAPTPAAAVINNLGTSGCAAPHPGDQVFWNGNTWCQLQEGQGGTGSTGTTAGSGGGATIYWASSDAPHDPVVECLRQNAGGCMPVQRGGPGSRGVLEGKEGPIAGQGGNGSKAAGRSETGRGRAKLSKAECERLRKPGQLVYPFKGELLELKQRGDKLDAQAIELGEAAGRLSRRLEDEIDRLPGFGGWAPPLTWWEWLLDHTKYSDLDPPTPQNFIERLRTYHSRSIEIAARMKEISGIVAKREAAQLESLDAARDAARVRADGERATEVARAECAATYGNQQR